MIAIDTNVLVYARRAELPHHSAARRIVRRLAEGDAPWAIPWPCVYEFVRVVTHPRILDPPSPLEGVLADLESLIAAPSLRLLGEGPAHPGHFRRIAADGGAKGNLAHDAHIAALVAEHGVDELWSADRDFARFSSIRVVNPFQG